MFFFNAVVMLVADGFVSLLWFCWLWMVLFNCCGSVGCEWCGLMLWLCWLRMVLFSYCGSVGWGWFCFIAVVLLVVDCVV